MVSLPPSVLLAGPPHGCGCGAQRHVLGGTSLGTVPGEQRAPALVGPPTCARRRGWSPAGKGGGLFSAEVVGRLSDIA